MCTPNLSQHPLLSQDSMLKPVTLFDQTNQIITEDILSPVEVEPILADEAKSPLSPGASALKLLSSSCSDRVPKYSRRQMRSRTTLMFGQYVTVPPMDPGSESNCRVNNHNVIHSNLNTTPSAQSSHDSSSSSCPSTVSQIITTTPTMTPFTDTSSVKLYDSCNFCYSCGSSGSSEKNKSSMKPCCKSVGCPANLNMPALNLGGNSPSFGVMEKPQQLTRKIGSSAQQNNVKENKKKRTNPARISHNYLPKKKMKG